MAASHYDRSNGAESGELRALSADDIAGVTSLYPLPIPPTTGPVSGTVTDAGTALPIAGASVSTDNGKSGTSAADGSYIVADVPTGSRTVTASASGHATSNQVVSVAEDITTTGVDFALAVVTEPTAVSVASVTYVTEGGNNNDKHLLITVALVNDQGDPVSGASLSISVDRDGSLFGTGSGTTGTAGTVTFSAKNAASGTYVTTVTAITAVGLTWDGLTAANSFDK